MELDNKTNVKQYKFLSLFQKMKVQNLFCRPLKIVGTNKRTEDFQAKNYVYASNRKREYSWAQVGV